MRRIGKKTAEWLEMKKVLVEKYRSSGITRCEGWGINKNCYGNWALSIHHLEKRSTGRARHTFEDTRLLCPSCHDLADHPINEEERKFNKELKSLR